MPNETKLWLVRTRTGEILGPYSQQNLLEELKKNTFSGEDEMAPSHGAWISAQTLTHREPEELTHTSTRSQVTRPTATASPAAATAPLLHIIDEKEEQPEEPTPTPDLKTVDELAEPFSKRPMPPRLPPTKGHLAKTIGPVITVSVVTIAIVTFILQLRSNEPSRPADIMAPSLPTHGEGESPFVRHIYSLIHQGENKKALNELTQYHEKHLGKGDIEYLIPYSALLITEKESPARARKFLEQVLSSAATPYLKSRAHHWLGYLDLSQEEGDMGEGHLLEALQLNPKDAAARFNLGRVYLKQEKYSQALDYLQLAELEVPDLWLVHIYKGRAKVSLGNMEEARIAFKMAAQTAPDRWITYIYYALFLMGIHETEAAQETLKKMLTRDPSYELHSPAPWGFYQEKVNYTEYLNAFSHIMEKGPGEERELGKLYINYLINGPSGNEGKKIEAYAEKGSLRSKVLALKVLLDRDAPAEELRTGLQRLPPTLAEFGYLAYVLRGEARSRLGFYQEAQQDFQKAISLEPRAALGHWAYAGFLKKHQRLSEAQNELKILLNYHPNYIPAIVLSH